MQICLRLLPNPISTHGSLYSTVSLVTRTLYVGWTLTHDFLLLTPKYWRFRSIDVYHTMPVLRNWKKNWYINIFFPLRIIMVYKTILKPFNPHFNFVHLFGLMPGMVVHAYNLGRLNKGDYKFRGGLSHVQKLYFKQTTQKQSSGLILDE